MQRTLTVLALAVLIPAAAAAPAPPPDPPDLVPLQLRLAQADGTPLEGAVSLEVRLYDAPTAGTLLWSESHAPTALNGVATVTLGSLTPFPPGLFEGGELWLALEVEGDGEMLPRRRVGSVPFAERAKTVENVELDDGAVDAAALAADAVTASKIAADAVGSGEIADGSVAEADLAGDAISGATIADGTVTAADLAAGAVDTAGLADLAVTSAKLALGAVGSDQIQVNAIVASKLADDAVLAQHIANGAVGSNQLALGAVDASHIAGSAVGSGEIASNAVGADEIAAGAVGSSEIADGAVGFMEIATGAVLSSDIFDGAVRTEDLDDDAVTAAKIADGTIDYLDIATDAVRSSEIIAQAVGGEEIKDGSIKNVDIAFDAQIASYKVENDFGGDLTTTTKLGVGTTAPTDELHVSKDGPARLRLEADRDDSGETDHATIELSQDGGLHAAWLGFTGGSDDLELIHDSPNDLHLGTAGLRRLTVNGSGGWLGVNTADPLATIHAIGGPQTGSLLLAPNESQSGDDSELFLAEDDDGSFGMKVRYDGGQNELQVLGTTTSGDTQAHLTVARGSGRTEIPGDLEAGPGATATPFAYGSVHEDGYKLGGSSNWTFEKETLNTYFVQLDGISDLSYANYAIQVQPFVDTPHIPTVVVEDGDTFSVRLFEAGLGVPNPIPFSFVVHEY